MADSSTENAGAVIDDTKVVDSASTPDPVVTAESTPADKPISPLDAVTRALDRSSKSGVEAGAPTAENRSPTGEPDPKTPPVAETPTEISDEEMKRFSPNAQARIRELAALKNDLNGKLETVTTERESLRPKAESYDKLTGYLSQNGISSDEANNSLEVTRLIKSGDFTNALKILDPIYQEVRKRAGEVLEPDLQEDVRLGNVPHDRALELQRLRANDAAARERGQRQEAQSREQQQREASSQFVNSIAKAADDWAKARAGSDPDWDKKQTEVAEIVELDLRRNGFPKSTEEAVQRSEKALAQVNDRWKKLRGPPAEIKPAVGGGRTSTRANDPPKTALEAVNRALGG
jgi:hypothetical protein